MMTSVLNGNLNCNILCQNRGFSKAAISSLPLLDNGGRLVSRSLYRKNIFSFPGNASSSSMISQKIKFITPKNSSSSDSNSSEDDSSNQGKTPFGYTRKDVILIGVGVTLLGYGLKYGLEFVGVDPLQAGNVVQLVLVLGLTVGWISTYIFRVSNKEMTYAQQLRDYEYKVMEKRLDSLTEADLAVLLEQVEEEKRLERDAK
ncbi:uncharacterized protein LOC126666832 isoform X2 [Mercurialis annua]|uniref:uncharacterized protein LOC126666832 isoform X1 n=1 Tax=Mercurialis annua TaxID=3986 RepID=UPI00215EA566|nr:uncharacterized protein LOC126666832 isoform X1 [Mercurialis annua]XP_050215664.1 uncharacterized protein LOC126666832 isoform X2 [Mercurialis annua]